MSELKRFSLIIFIISVVFLNVCQCMLRKEAYATVPQLISSAGYPLEKHRAKTEDGYTLQLHRIPAGRRSARRSDTPSNKGKRAVLLVHGLLGSSGDFVIMGPKNSLAYILADAGYDVWLGNLRGTSYSAHRNYTRNDPAFWNYCFHEHGIYDAPAMIDKVLEVTGLPRILYIGYSMGTTTFFTMISEKPEYNDKLIAFVALAPAVYLDNVRSFANLALKNLDLINLLRERGMLSVAFRRDLVDFVAENFCTVKDPDNNMCTRVMYSIVGEDYEQHDWDMTSVIIMRMQPASWRQLEHFGKIALTGVFTTWEDGLWGAVKPYNMSNVRIPVSIRYGENDHLTEKSQILRLAKELKQSGVLYSVEACPWPKFNHLDFIIAKNVGDLMSRPLAAHIGQLYNTFDSQ